MTYATGGPIEAFDYNTFATLSGSMNEVYADLYPGATTLPNAGYGYGQTPALVPVAVGDNILASEWAALFEVISKCAYFDYQKDKVYFRTSNTILKVVKKEKTSRSCRGGLINT